MAAEWLPHRRKKVKTWPRGSVKLEYASAATGWPNQPSFRCLAHCFPLLVPNLTAYIIKIKRRSAGNQKSLNSTFDLQCRTAVSSFWKVFYRILYETMSCTAGLSKGYIKHPIQESKLKLGRLHSDPSSNDSNLVCVLVK